MAPLRSEAALARHLPLAFSFKKRDDIDLHLPRLGRTVGEKAPVRRQRSKGSEGTSAVRDDHKRLVIPFHGEGPDLFTVSHDASAAIKNVFSVAGPIGENQGSVILKQQFLRAAAVGALPVDLVFAIADRTVRDPVSVR